MADPLRKTRKSNANRIFGWCMDGHHDGCRVSFFSSMTEQEYVCECECHSQKQTNKNKTGKRKKK